MYYLKLLNWTKSYFPNVQKRDERDKEKKGYFAYFFSLINDSDNGSEIIQPASCSQSYIGDAAINTWYKVLSKILNTFSGVAALIFVARLLG